MTYSKIQKVSLSLKGVFYAQARFYQALFEAFVS